MAYSMCYEQGRQYIYILFIAVHFLRFKIYLLMIDDLAHGFHLGFCLLPLFVECAVA